MTTIEIWKDIPWYEWLYQVSNLWIIKFLWWFKKNHSKNIWMRDRILSLNNNGKYWHKFVRLKWKKYYVHRLVAQSFLWLNITDTKTFVCHKDDNPSNNALDNLFLWSCKENIHDCIKKWRNVVKFKTNHCFLKEEDVLYIKNSIWILTQNTLAKMFNIDQSHISRIQNNLARKYW